MIKSLQNAKGFTIVELITASMMSVMLSLCFFAAFEVMQRGYYAERGHFSSNRSARYILDQISKDAKEAVRIESSYSGTATDDENITLRLPGIDATGNVINISSTFDYVVYRTSGSTLTRSLYVNAASARNGGANLLNREVGSNIDSIFFASANGTGLSGVSDVTGIKRLRIQLTAQETVRNATQTMLAETDVMLRNLL